MHACVFLRVYCIFNGREGRVSVYSTLFPVTHKMPGWGEVVFLCVFFCFCVVTGWGARGC